MTHTLIWIAAFVLLSVALGISYQALGTRRDARVHPPPGRMVDLGTHRLHVLEKGFGAPTIVFESGVMSTVLSWTVLHEELSRSYRVVSYDRAGLGWSDLGPMPRTAGRIVEELHTLLERVAVPPPYVLVGHSFGGLTMPLFAALYPAETGGMVLVDPVAPGEWNPPSEHDQRLVGIGARVCRRAAFLSRLGFIRFVALLLTTGAKGPASYLIRQISRGTPVQSGSVSSPWFWALPAKERAMASMFWVQAKFAMTVASQLENLPASAASLSALDYLCDRPVVILSAKDSPQRRYEEHAAMAKRFPHGDHLTAKNSNHWIMVDEPALVLDAIRRVADSPRETPSSSAPETTDCGPGS